MTRLFGWMMFFVLLALAFMICGLASPGHVWYNYVLGVLAIVMFSMFIFSQKIIEFLGWEDEADRPRRQVATTSATIQMDTGLRERETSEEFIARLTREQEQRVNELFERVREDITQRNQERNQQIKARSEKSKPVDPSTPSRLDEIE